MPKVSTDIPDDLYSKLEEEVQLGMFKDISSAINAALRKAYAKKSRSYLRWLAKKEDISEDSILEELKKIRE